MQACLFWIVVFRCGVYDCLFYVGLLLIVLISDLFFVCYCCFCCYVVALNLFDFRLVLDAWVCLLPSAFCFVLELCCWVVTRCVAVFKLVFVYVRLFCLGIWCCFCVLFDLYLFVVF